MARLLVALLCGVSALICAPMKEPSAFDKQSGATRKDLSTLQSNTQALLNLATQLKSQQDELSRSQEGLQSLYESQAQNIQTTINKSNANEEHIQRLQNELDSLKQAIESNKNTLQQLDSKLKQLQALVLEMQQGILKELEKIAKKQ
ncbi:hypothetical protein ACWIWK_01865 [Helicobacter sp. 23-1048]